MQQDHSFTQRTVQSPTSADMVMGEARAVFHYGCQLTKVMKEEHAYSFERDEPRMGQTNGRFVGTGAELLDVEQFRMDAEPTAKTGPRSRTTRLRLKHALSVRVSNVPAPPRFDAWET